jgi:hypothetical protein
VGGALDQHAQQLAGARRGTGGLVNEEGDELSAFLRRIAAAVRDAR